MIILRIYPLEVEELQELKKSQRTVLYLFWEKDEEDDGQGCKALSRKPWREEVPRGHGNWWEKPAQKESLDGSKF